MSCACGMVLLLLAGANVLAQGTGHGMPQRPAEPGVAMPTQEERFRRRFPQPVLVSDLIGRSVLDAQQGVLGRVVALIRAPDGEAQIVFARRRLLGLASGPSVAVPVKKAALLGPFVMILDVSEEELGRLAAPVVDAPAVDGAARIEMALTKH